MGYSLQSVFKGSSVYTTGQILTKFLALFLIPLYTRFLTPKDYGIIGYLQVLIIFLSTLLMLGFASAQTRYYYEYSDKQQKGEFLFSINIFLICILFIVCFSLTVWGKSVYLRLSIKEIPFHPYLPIAIWAIFFQIINQMIISFYLADKQFEKCALLRIVEFLMTTAMVILFVVGLKQGAIGMFKGFLFGNMLFTFLFYWGYAGHFKLHFSHIYIKAALSFGVPIVLYLLAGNIFEFIDRVILEKYVTIEDLGIYTLGCQLGMIMNVLVVSMNQAWKPNYYDLMTSKTHKRAFEMRRAFSVWLFVVGAICITGMLWAKEIVFLITPPKYHFAAGIVPFIIFAYMLKGAYFFLSTPILFFKKTKVMPVLAGISAALNIALNLLFIPRFGIYGAAYATVISFACQIIITYIYSNKLFDSKYELIKILIVFFFLAAILFFKQLDQVSLKIEIAKVLILITFCTLNYFLFQHYLRPIFHKIQASIF